MKRYSRQTMLPEIGEAGQSRLREAKVLVVGLGGLGSPVATYLTGAGVGTIGLVDADVVSESNLQRQVLYTEAQIGQPKVDCAVGRLAALSRHTRFECYPCFLTPENAEEIIARFDLVVDCCDNFATRYLIDDTCARLGRTWVYGSIGAFRGQVAVLNGRAGVRYSDIYPDREALAAMPSSSGGVIGPVPGVVGAIQANEAIKIIAGFDEPLDGRLFTIDLKTLQTNIISFE